MAITLNSTLKAALDGIDHKPIIDLNVQSLVNSIPITPTKLPKVPWEQTNRINDRPTQVAYTSMSDGRLVMLYTGYRWFYSYENPNPSFSFINDGQYYYLAMRVSDVERKEFGSEIYLYLSSRITDGLTLYNCPISAVSQSRSIFNINHKYIWNIYVISNKSTYNNFIFIQWNSTYWTIIKC